MKAVILFIIGWLTYIAYGLKWHQLPNPLNEDTLASNSPLEDLYGQPSFNIHFDEMEFDHDFSYDVKISFPLTVVENKEKLTFQCFYSQPTQKNEDLEFLKLSEEQKIEHVLNILSPLENLPCPIYKESWWKWQYCHKNKIRQYHESEKIQTEIFIGKYSSNSTICSINDGFGTDLGDAAIISQRSRSFIMKYNNGSVCDITGKPRTTTVEFRCKEGPGVYIAKVQELSSCNYYMLIEVGLLCKEPWFIESMPKPLSLTCQLNKSNHSLAALHNFKEKLHQLSQPSASLFKEIKTMESDVIAGEEQKDVPVYTNDPLAKFAALLGKKYKDEKITVKVLNMEDFMDGENTSQQREDTNSDSPAENRNEFPLPEKTPSDIFEEIFNLFSGKLKSETTEPVADHQEEDFEDENENDREKQEL